MRDPYPGETIRQIVAGEQGGIPVLPPYKGEPLPPPRRRTPITIGNVLKWLSPLAAGASAAAGVGSGAGTIAGGGTAGEAIDKAKEAIENPLKAPLQVAKDAAGQEGAATFWLVNGLLVIALIMGLLWVSKEPIAGVAKFVA